MMQTLLKVSYILVITSNISQAPYVILHAWVHLLVKRQQLMKMPRPRVACVSYRNSLYVLHVWSMPYLLMTGNCIDPHSYKVQVNKCTKQRATWGNFKVGSEIQKVTYSFKSEICQRVRIINQAQSSSLNIRGCSWSIFRKGKQNRLLELISPQPLAKDSVLKC